MRGVGGMALIEGQWGDCQIQITTFRLAVIVRIENLEIILGLCFQRQIVGHFDVHWLRSNDWLLPAVDAVGWICINGRTY